MQAENVYGLFHIFVFIFIWCEWINVTKYNCGMVEKVYSLPKL